MPGDVPARLDEITLVVEQATEEKWIIKLNLVVVTNFGRTGSHLTLGYGCRKLVPPDAVSVDRLVARVQGRLRGLQLSWGDTFSTAFQAAVRATKTFTAERCLTAH